MEASYIANRVMKLAEGGVCRPGDRWVPPKGAGHQIISSMVRQGHIKEVLTVTQKRKWADK